MPPIFGIIKTDLQSFEPEMANRMKGVANYIIPRKIKAIEILGGYFATAVVNEDPPGNATDSMAVFGDHVIIADAGLYKGKELLVGLMKLQNEERERQGNALLILKAWQKWGEKCVHYLYGDFTFVIFSIRSGEIFCGRDALGVRPFFYTLHENTFIFGSELRYVLASFKTRPALQKGYLLDTLLTVKSIKELTLYESIFRLKPGHFLHISGRNTLIHQFWQIDPEKTIRFSGQREYIDLFREKLVNAVNMRCAGVSDLGSELSGGLDSSAVTGITADFPAANDISLTAFSNLFPSNTDIEFKDEREYISNMQKYKRFGWIGIDHLNQTIEELLRYTIDIQGCFVQQNFNIFNRGIYEAVGERRIQTLLSGFGGDEMVSARVAVPWNEYIQGRYWDAFKDELFNKGMTAKSFLKAGRIALRYCMSFLYHHPFSTGIFSPEFHAKRYANFPLQPAYCEKNALRERYEEKYRRLARKKLSLRQLDRIMLNHLPQRMEYCYAAAAQYGVEYRYPLLDIDLIETYLTFPPWMKQYHGINRYVFRQAIIGFVPEEIRQRDDKSVTTIPHLYFSILKEKELIMRLVETCSGQLDLAEIMDFKKFPQWYEKLAKRDMTDLNYMNPGAFYNYLMIMIYFRDHV